MKAYLGRFAFIIIVVGLLGLAWGLKGTRLGQDLAGGAELRYGVTRRITRVLTQYQLWLAELDDAERVARKKARVADIDRLLEKAEGADADRLKREKSDLELALDRTKLREAINELKRQEKAVGAGADIIRRRLDGSGMANIEVRTLGTSRILIRLPYERREGESEDAATERFNQRLDEIQKLVEQQGVLNFNLGVSTSKYGSEYDAAARRADDGQEQSRKYLYVLPKERYDEVVANLKDHGIDDPLRAGYLPWDAPRPDEALTTKKKKNEKRSPLLLERDKILDGSIIDRAYPRVGGEGWFEIGLDLTPKGAGQFERVSGENIERQLAIVLDNICYSAPVIQNKIAGGRAVITGQFTEATATDLATVLTAGSLPVQIEYESKKVIGPSLGRDSIDAGIRAFVVGFSAVVLFMLVYYLSGGVVAVIALVLNLIIVMGALAAFNANLTLPGIAGILLTVGMAVDANVLIFERIREEKAKGRTLRLAIQAGFDRAFVTIIDSNITTILTALILYWFGSGPIKGFAVTLIIGISASLFTALYVARAIIEMLLSIGVLKEMTMLKAIGETKIPFMKIRPFTYVLSAIVVAGALYAFVAYPDKYGIDFAGGTMLQVGLEKPMPDDEMRAHADGALVKMQELEKKRSVDQGRSPIDFGSARVQAIVKSDEVGGASSFFLMLRMDAYQLQEYEKILAAELGEALNPVEPFPSQETIGQTVSEELGADAIRAIVFAVIVVFLYILLRFEFNPSFGVGAIVALVHDVSITVGALAAADWMGLVPAKFDLTSVAAILTILGYSLNDTIVVYDRMREVRAGGKNRPMKEIADEAINTVLSRTIVTSLTTLLAAVALFYFGGETTKGFALAMIVGVVAGTYSSSFIAAPIVVEWEKLRDRPKLKKTMAIMAGCAVVLAASGFIWQAVNTYDQKMLEEEDKGKIERVWNALNSYAAKHGDTYPADLKSLVPDYLNDEEALAGAGAKAGVGYNYLAGLDHGDTADNVLLYTPDDRLQYGGHVVFVDGRVAWMDHRKTQAAVRATLNKYASDDTRDVHNVEATSVDALPSPTAP
jgi:SecD/SecF fusion protein